MSAAMTPLTGFRTSMAQHADDVWLCVTTDTPSLSDSAESEPPSPRLPHSPHSPVGDGVTTPHPLAPSSWPSLSSPSSSSSSSSSASFCLSSSAASPSPWSSLVMACPPFDTSLQPPYAVSPPLALLPHLSLAQSGVIHPTSASPTAPGSPFRIDAFQPSPAPLSTALLYPSPSKPVAMYPPPPSGVPQTLQGPLVQPLHSALPVHSPSVPISIGSCPAPGLISSKRPIMPSSPAFEQLQKDRADSRSSSLPPPNRPRPVRRRTQEVADIPSIAALYPALFPSSYALDNSSATAPTTTLSTSNLSGARADGKPSKRPPVRGWSGHSTSGYAPLPTPSSSNTSVDDLMTPGSGLGTPPPRLLSPSWALYPATDHPLSEAEMRDVWERLKRDLAGVDPESLRGPFRQLALSMTSPNNSTPTATTTLTMDGAALLGKGGNVSALDVGLQSVEPITGSPGQLVKSFVPSTSQAAAVTPKGRPLNLTYQAQHPQTYTYPHHHHPALMSPARSVASNSGVLDDIDANAVARTTVSPKEAFVDYEDVSHRLEDAKALRRAAAAQHHQQQQQQQQQQSQHADAQSPKSASSFGVSNSLFGGQPGAGATTLGSGSERTSPTTASIPAMGGFASNSCVGSAIGAGMTGRPRSPALGHITGMTHTRRASSPLVGPNISSSASATSPTGRGSVGPEDSKKVVKLLPHHVPKNAMRVGVGIGGSGSCTSLAGTAIGGIGSGAESPRRSKLGSPPFTLDDVGDSGTYTSIQPRPLGIEAGMTSGALDQSSDDDDDDLMASSAELETQTAQSKGMSLFPSNALPSTSVLASSQLQSRTGDENDELDDDGDDDDDEDLDDQDEEEGVPGKSTDFDASHSQSGKRGKRRIPSTCVGGGKSLPLVYGSVSKSPRHVVAMSRSSSDSTAKVANLSTPSNQASPLAWPQPNTPRRSGRSQAKESERDTRSSRRKAASATAEAVSKQSTQYDPNDSDEEDDVERDDDVQMDEDHNDEGDSDRDPVYVPSATLAAAVGPPSTSSSSMLTRRRNAAAAAAAAAAVASGSTPTTTPPASALKSPMSLASTKKRKQGPYSAPFSSGWEDTTLQSRIAGLEAHLQSPRGSLTGVPTMPATMTANLMGTDMSRKKRQRTHSPRSHQALPISSTYLSTLSSPTLAVTPITAHGTITMTTSNSGRPKGSAPATLAAGGVPLPGGQIQCDWIDPDTGHVCEVIFRRPYDLARHKETIHTVGGKKPTWLCQECGGEFSRKDALYRHCRIKNHKSGLPA